LSSNFYYSPLILIIDYDATKPKDEKSYTYYVHFENFDKRNDDWVPFSRIKTTNIKIEDSSAKTSYAHPN
jgi:hypothetical protein